MTVREGRTANGDPSSTRRANRWLPLTRMRPYVGPEAAFSGELSNPLLSKRAGMSRAALLELIASTARGATATSCRVNGPLQAMGFLDGPQLDAATQSGIAHWIQRNWEQSLDIYLWSRRWEFDDNGSEFEEARDRILEAFLAEESEPPMRTAGGEGRLCSPAQTPDITMGEVLWRRCSSHRMVPRPLPQDKLSAILASGCAQIRIPRNQPAHGDRPDYGYLVGLDRVYDIFILAFDVSGLESGIYFYDLRNDRIELIRQGEFRQEAQRCLIGQAASLTSGAALFLTTDFRRIQYVYRHDRVIRNTFINAGRIMQALVLQATAFDLHTSITPAVNDRVACELLKLDPGESQVLYTLSLS